MLFVSPRSVRRTFENIVEIFKGIWLHRDVISGMSLQRISWPMSITNEMFSIVSVDHCLAVTRIWLMNSVTKCINHIKFYLSNLNTPILHCDYHKQIH